MCILFWPCLNVQTSHQVHTTCTQHVMKHGASHQVLPAADAAANVQPGQNQHIQQHKRSTLTTSAQLSWHDQKASSRSTTLFDAKQKEQISHAAHVQHSILSSLHRLISVRTGIYQSAVAYMCCLVADCACIHQFAAAHACDLHTSTTSCTAATSTNSTNCKCAVGCNSC